MLQLEDLSVSLGGSSILRGISLDVRANRVFCLMGRNGVGKTTTLKSIMGIHRARKGKIIFQGRDISALPSEERARLGIAYVPQGRGIFPHLTVEENLIIGAVAQGKKFRGLLERVDALFPVLKDFRHRKGGMLSGGQQQQLAIGRALLTDPQLLILDEPTEGIQPNIIDHIGDALKLLRRGGHPREEGLLAEASQLVKKTLETFPPDTSGTLEDFHERLNAIRRAPAARKREDYEGLNQVFEKIRGEHPHEGRLLWEEISSALRLLHEQKSMTILLVEQYLDFCRELADDFAILDRGSVAASGLIGELTDGIVKTHLTV